MKANWLSVPFNSMILYAWNNVGVHLILLGSLGLALTLVMAHRRISKHFAARRWTALVIITPFSVLLDYTSERSMLMIAQLASRRGSPIVSALSPLPTALVVAFGSRNRIAIDFLVIGILAVLLFWRTRSRDSRAIPERQ
jgi:hypothetical protein